MKKAYEIKRTPSSENPRIRETEKGRTFIYIINIKKLKI
jgi:hypothetical protein